MKIEYLTYMCYHRCYIPLLSTVVFHFTLCLFSFLLFGCLYLRFYLFYLASLSGNHDLNLNIVFWL